MSNTDDEYKPDGSGSDGSACPCCSLDDDAEPLETPHPASSATKLITIAERTHDIANSLTPSVAVVEGGTTKRPSRACSEGARSESPSPESNWASTVRTWRAAVTPDGQSPRADSNCRSLRTEE